MDICMTSDRDTTIVFPRGEIDLAEVLTPVVANARGLFGRLTGSREFSEFPGRSGLADEIVTALEARAIWSRFGF